MGGNRKHLRLEFEPIAHTDMIRTEKEIIARRANGRIHQ